MNILGWQPILVNRNEFYRNTKILDHKNNTCKLYEICHDQLALNINSYVKIFISPNPLNYLTLLNQMFNQWKLFEIESLINRSSFEVLVATNQKIECRSPRFESDIINCNGLQMHILFIYFITIMIQHETSQIGACIINIQ